MQVQDSTPGVATSGLRVDGARLWDSLMRLARIGATDKGGVCRLALTELDREARNLFVAWAKETGCTVRVDAIGNIFARRAGERDDLPPVTTGSHIDTQPTGGKFDGNYGVLAGLEVLRTLDDAGVRTHAPLEVAVWTNEEGSRFVPVMMGSGVFAGAFTLDHALAQCDRDGVSVRDALAAIGYAGDADDGRGAHPVGAYFEAHIEQGPVLEQAGLPIGVVTGVQGIYELDVTVTGFESHAGTTPMSVRRDAMGVAAAMIASIVEHGHAFDDDARVTVGHVACQPNSPSTIPGKVRFSVDVRHPSRPALQQLVADIEAICVERTALRGTSVQVQTIAEYEPVVFDAECVERVRQATAAAGYPYKEMCSGAGHDAVNLSYVAPSAMVFVPCKAGLSHNEAEDADPVHLAQGASVLANLLADCAR